MPVVGPNGVMTPAWRRFFEDSWRRSGGFSDYTLVQDSAQATGDATLAQVAADVDQIAREIESASARTESVGGSLEEEIRALRKEIEGIRGTIESLNADDTGAIVEEVVASLQTTLAATADGETQQALAQLRNQLEGIRALVDADRGSDFSWQLQELTTDSVAEGAINLYYTDARARDAISESSAALSYNSTTGVFTTSTPITALGGLTPAADRLPYFDGASSAALATFTGVARTLVGQSTQALMRTTGLGLGTVAIENIGTSGATVPFMNTSNTWSGAQTVTARFTISGSGGWLNLTTQSATIASGSVAAVGSNMTLDTEGGAASDDLDTITGGNSGDMLIIRTTADARDIVVKHSTGNIKLNGAADLTLASIYSTLTLQRLSAGWWVEIGRSAVP